MIFSLYVHCVSLHVYECGPYWYNVGRFGHVTTTWAVPELARPCNNSMIAALSDKKSAAKIRVAKCAHFSVWTSTHVSISPL